MKVDIFKISDIENQFSLKHPHTSPKKHFIKKSKLKNKNLIKNTAMRKPI